MVDAETEIRKLRPKELCSLATILSPDSWKILLGIIPKEGSKNDLMFTKEHLDIIEYAGEQQRRLPAEIFLEEWSTMGRERPTIRKLMDSLVQVELFRAADYLANILQKEPPQRPQSGPAAPVDISINVEEISDSQIFVHEVNDVNDAQKENYAAPSINNDNLQHVYEEEKCHAENVSKFPFNSKSDLMKFSSCSLSGEKSNNYDIQYGEEQEENDLPNLKELNLHSYQDGDINQGKIPSEKSSSSFLSDSSDLSTCESSCCHSSSSSQSIVHPKDSSLTSDNLPVILKLINERKITSNFIQDSLSNDSHQDLPLPILELSKR